MIYIQCVSAAYRCFAYFIVMRFIFSVARVHGYAIGRHLGALMKIFIHVALGSSMGFWFG